MKSPPAPLGTFTFSTLPVSSRSTEDVQEPPPPKAPVHAGDRVDNMALATLKISTAGLHPSFVSRAIASCSLDLAGLLPTPPLGQLTLSEGLVLLWHDSDSGHIRGRQASLDLKAVVLACIFLDLESMGRISFIQKPGRLWGERVIVIVINTELTGNTACDLLLGKLSRTTRTFSGWLLHSYATSGEYITAIIASLISRNVLGAYQRGCSGVSKRFPLENTSAKQDLMIALRKVVLKRSQPWEMRTQIPPDPFHVILLRMCQLADKFYFGNLVLGHFFSEDELRGNVKLLIERFAYRLAAGTLAGGTSTSLPSSPRRGPVSVGSSTTPPGSPSIRRSSSFFGRNRRSSSPGAGVNSQTVTSPRRVTLSTSSVNNTPPGSPSTRRSSSFFGRRPSPVGAGVASATVTPVTSNTGTA